MKIINFKCIFIINFKMEQDKPKIHKTLNQKLKKKRQKLKQLKKTKKQKHDAYDRDEQKAKFFEKGQKKIKKDKKRDSYNIKVYKLKRQLMNFTKVYEDELQDFYQIWKNLDQGGEIQIDEIENAQIRKCMKKICKYLQLQKNNKSYRKSNPSINLKSYVEKKFNQVIENYLQNGTQQSQLSDSDDEKLKNQKKQQKEKKQKKLKKDQQKKPQIKKQQIVEDQKISVGPVAPVGPVGPFIPNFDRELIEKMFEETIKNVNQQKRKEQQEQDQLDKIFGYQPKKKVKIEKEIPDHLYATGSARIEDGTDCQEALNNLDKYNKAYRGKSLMQQHQQMLKSGMKGETKTYQRKPFTRQSMGSDKVDTKRLDSMLQNGTFFDFNDKMSKPTLKKSFL